MYGSVFNVQSAVAFNNFISLASLIDFLLMVTLTLGLSDIPKIIGQGGSNEVILNDRSILLKELHDIISLDLEEMAQKAKVRWAIEGDENSKPISHRICLVDVFTNQLSLEQQDDLERTVSIEEIKRAVWDCGTNKSHGPDSFTFEFFRRYWKFLENDISVAAMKFFSSGTFPKGCNSSFIALIPKTQFAKTVKDFCPISLIGSLYKIIAKILANRLSFVIPGLISDVQSTFISNRRILDGPFIRNELLSWCKYKKLKAMVLADKAILPGADNRPPMLEKDMYDSWKSRMELYMLNRQHGRMILESVENGPLLWPTVEEDGVTRLKKYSELSATEAIQADCNVKATNIILQGLPLEGESLRDFYLRFSLLLNDMNIYNMKLKQFQHSYHQHQFQPQASTYQSSPYATPYHPPQYASQAPSSTNLSISYPPNDIQSSVNHNVYNASSSIPHMKYAPTIHQQTEFSPPDTGLVVLVFQKGDDPIDAINHMMSFLTVVVTSRYPATNNQLRTSSNPRQQATINNGRVTIQPIQGRQISMTAGSSRPYTSGSSGTSGKQRVIVCYNCKGKGHMSKQCTKPKRKRDAEWFKDKDSDCDKLNLAKIALMANLSHYGSDNLAE
nr:RNA-directed DNA polymerase, eukaryota, reverse transcriptase zinc-binding domain protein [Tanacetum cinerariifolium]